MGKKLLLDCLSKDLDWLVIDESGPLELEGKGLEPAVSKILIEDEKYGGNILCVVRESLLDKFVEHYMLEDTFELINLDQNQD